MVCIQYLFSLAFIGFGEFSPNGLNPVFKSRMFQRCFFAEMKETVGGFYRISETQLFYELQAKALKTKTLKMLSPFDAFKRRRFETCL